MCEKSCNQSNKFKPGNIVKSKVNGFTDYEFLCYSGDQKCTVRAISNSGIFFNQDVGLFYLKDNSKYIIGSFKRFDTNPRVHNTLELAEQECERLAKIEHGVEFTVYKAISKFVAATPTVTKTQM